MAKRWSKDDDRALFMGLGAYGTEWFKPRVGRSYDYKGAPTQRTTKALYGRVRRLCDGGGLGRGAISLRQLRMTSGYSDCQILRAREALNQKWKRINPGGAYIITEEQAEDVLSWLKNDYWAPILRIYACVDCGTRKHKHRSLGHCEECYWVLRKALYAAKFPTRREPLLARLTEIGVGLAGEAADLCQRMIQHLREGRAPTCHEIRRLAAYGDAPREPS